MANERVIELGLNDQSGRRQADALRALVEQTVELLRDAFAVYDATEYDECCSGLEACRVATADGTDAADLTTRFSPCLEQSREAVADIKVKQQQRRRELTELIGLIRELVSAAGIEHHGLRDSLNQSLDRFEAVGQHGDIQEIKTRLATEIRATRLLMAERLRVWETRVEQLGKRIALLEDELLATQLEASFDPLTQVANRRAFDRICRNWATNGGSGFVVAMMDIDDFKGVNDAVGHTGGDRALIAVAQALKATVRSEDLVARMGGDEFALIIPGLTLRQADSRLRSIVTSIANAKIEATPGSTLTVSCGAAEFSAGDTLASLTHRADEALYEAKRAGKNRLVTKARPFVSDLMKRR